MNLDTLTQPDNWQEQQQITPAEQQLYDYWLNRVPAESPDLLLEDFRSLFIEGRGVSQADVYSAFEKVVKAKDGQEKFHYCLNRCCHILIDRWQVQPEFHSAILELIGLFEQLPSPRGSERGTANKLGNLLNSFRQSDHYLKLRRLGRVIAPSQSNKSVGSLIHRYPYLYDYCLLSEGSSTEHQQTVRRLKVASERRFEVNLSQYITYKARLARIARSPNQSAESKRTISPVNNPTLLKDSKLSKAIQQFIGPAEGGQTYKSLSRNFINHGLYAPTFQAFKEELYEYLSASLDSPYGQVQLTPKLYEILQNTLPQSNHQKPSEFLMLRTCSQLLNVLIVESTSQPEHYLFINMIGNLGITCTIGLLLKVVLICPKVKPYLEKRFSILFEHYESLRPNEAPWLVNALEYFQIALRLHFGKIDLSGLN